jgi:glycosyltransferase involved in cell wall biosynthesis
MYGQDIVANKIIQSLWVGKLSTMERLCIRSFIVNGHDFHLYTYDQLENVPAGCVVKDANEIVPKSDISKFKYIQQFADYFRYALLLKQGGWWVDMDVVCLRPFNFSEDYVFVESTGPVNEGLNFAVIKVPTPNCPLVKACFDAAESFRAHWRTMEFQAIGPNLWAKKINDLALTEYIKPIDMFDPIHWDKLSWSIDPTKKWDLSHAYALHLFHAAWNKGSQAFNRNFLVTDGTYPKGCLYEQLKERFLNTPRVSVVITTINRSAQLRVTFETFARQSFKDYEVVVVDDGTDTETPALCAETWPFPIRYFRLDRLRSPEYHNSSVVANYGVKQAYGEVIILQCAECKHVGEVLAELASRVTPNNAVMCRADHLNPDGTVNPTKTDYMNIVREKQALFFCGAIYKSWFYKLRGFDERYERFYGADDIDFSERLAFAGCKFEYATTFVQHQWHPIPAATAEGGQSLLDSQADAHKFLIKNREDMAAGRIGPIRNLDKEWGEIVNVSIVITTFNRPALLDATLTSINKQGFRNLEIVVVDDGTDEDTQDVCKRHCATYIKLNRPQSTTYSNPALPINVGVRYAKGNIILLQNAECVHADTHTIEKLTKAVTDNNVAFAHVTGLKADGRPDWVYCGKESPRPFFFCGAIKRAWFDKLRGMDEDFVKPSFDDNDFADRLRASGVTFLFTDVKVNHLWHQQLSHNNSESAKLYQEKVSAMAAGKITAMRNLDREWGTLLPESKVIPAMRELYFTDLKGSYFGADIVHKPVPTVPYEPVSEAITPFSQRIAGARAKYAKDGLTIDWWSNHRRI